MLRKNLSDFLSFAVLVGVVLSLQASAFVPTNFQRIKADRFTMGSPESEKHRNPIEDQIDVIITRPFEIMDTEVTQQQWFDVMKTNPSEFRTPEDCDDHTRVRVNAYAVVDLCPSRPVESVSWNKIQIYIQRLNKGGAYLCDGVPQDPKGCYRLPTEAEWEYAARGGTQTAYSFGNSSSNLQDYAWYEANSEEQTHPVAQKRANPYGLYDMHGNVQEWVQDRYDGRLLPGGRDPLQALSSSSYRGVRGGSWYNKAWGLRSAYRRGVNQDDGYSNIGFRLVRNL